MLLAELEIRHSRAVAPTRRVALGDLWLPTDPPPGFGGILLAGHRGRPCVSGSATISTTSWTRSSTPWIEAPASPNPGFATGSRPMLSASTAATTAWSAGARRCVLELDDHGAVLPQVLGAVYAASKLSYRARATVFRLIRRATRWQGDNDERLMAYLTGDEAAYRPWRTPAHNEDWARKILGFARHDEPTRNDIQTTFRRLVRTAHPDHGGASERAGQRITELTQAKRILLADA